MDRPVTSSQKFNTIHRERIAAFFSIETELIEIIQTRFSTRKAYSCTLPISTNMLYSVIPRVLQIFVKIEARATRIEEGQPAHAFAQSSSEFFLKLKTLLTILSSASREGKRNEEET